MLKIRLMRIGAKKRPFYRVVAVDERNKRTGGYLELLGTYNPISNPHEINLKQDRIDEWFKKGAQPSDGFLRIIGKAPQRLPRKPKKTAVNLQVPKSTEQKPLATNTQSDENNPEKEQDQKIGLSEPSLE
ncbi:30S ribosomal protein S16 [Candidatus Daviesbacteria bacterium]|nr:30S ribosomal protein S16 [Candidatus Daviesbacteria bacterium]